MRKDGQYSRWFSNYLDLVIERDVIELSRGAAAGDASSPAASARGEIGTGAQHRGDGTGGRHGEEQCRELPPAPADEVDLVLERDDGDVIAFEIKSGTRVHGEDLRGMRALRARLGTRLTPGLVLYTGALAYTNDDGTHVVPIDALWT
ncbi:hypothetical protein [Dactylosporangium sp. NPDC006015]|uniref:hypothetical protein n=1 Tax=Dactylosporangium sp. NPDC006015 TaxID=3154576 RepID=UPI0033BA4AF5